MASSPWFIFLCTMKLFDGIIMCGVLTTVGSTTSRADHSLSIVSRCRTGDIFPLAMMIDRLLYDIGWNSFTVVVDDTSDNLVSEITRTERHKPLLVRLVTCSQITQSALSAAENFLLVANASCTRQLLRTAVDVDRDTSRKTYLRHMSRWLVVTSDIHMCPIEQIMKMFDHVTVMSCGRPQGFCCYDHMTIPEVRPQLHTLMWGENTGRRWQHIPYNFFQPIHLKTVFPNLRFGFNRRKFTITTIEWPGYVYKTVTNGTAVFTGFCMDLLDQLSENLNFTYDLMEPPDGQWGMLANGQWTGIIGQLVRKEIDLAMTALNVDSARDEIIDFVSPAFFQDSKDIMYRTPDPAETKWRLLFSIFRKEVLLCTTVAMVTCTFLLSIMESSGGSWPSLQQLLEALAVCLEYMFGALFHQSGRYNMWSSSGRVLVATWWYFAVILAITYSANLTAFLAVPIHSPPFTSLREMLNNPDYTWGFIGGGSTETIISNSPHPDIKELWQKIRQFNQTDPDVLSNKNDLQIQKVMTQKYAYIMGHEKQRQEIACQITFVGEQITSFEYSMGIPSESSLKKPFDAIMSHMLESGLLEGLKRKWIEQHGVCEVLQSRRSGEVYLEDVLSVLFLLALGVGTSCLALGGEVCVKVLVRRRRERKQDTNVDDDLSASTRL